MRGTRKTGSIHVRLDREMRDFLDARPERKSQVVREALRRLMDEAGPTGSVETENAVRV